MNAMSWITEKITARIGTLLGGLMLARTEASVVEAHAECLAQIERRAKSLEEEGLPELADRLRVEARSLSVAAPGGIASQMAEQWENDPLPPGLISPPRDESAQPSSQSSLAVANGTPKKAKLGRPRKADKQASS